MKHGNRGAFWRFLLEERGFRRLWLSTALSELAATVARVAFILLIHERAVARGGAAETANALMLIAETAPMAAFGPIAGALVDRCDRRALLVLANLLQMALVGCVPFAAVLAPDWPLYLLAMAISTISTVFPPARQSSIPDLVGLARAPAANAISSSTTSFVFILGAGAAGLLLAQQPKDVCFWVAAASFLLSAAVVLPLALPRWAGERHGVRQLLGEVVAGVAYVRGRPQVGFIVACYLMAFVFIGVWFPLVPEYLRREIGVSADVWMPRTWLAFGLGGIAGGALGPWIGRTVGMGRALVLTFFVEPFLIATFYLAQGPWAVMVLSFLWGVLAFAYFVQEHTILQQDVAPELRGRVFGLLPPLQALGTLAANGVVLAEGGRIAPRTMMLLSGATYLVASGATLLALRGGRELMRRPNRIDGPDAG
jgi:MFS family permease